MQNTRLAFISTLIAHFEIAMHYAVTKWRYGETRAPQRAFSPCAQVYGELWGQERPGFEGLSAVNPSAPPTRS